MVALNPEAPKFFPTHSNQLQQPLPCPDFTLSIFPPHYQHHYYCYYTCSSFPSRELRPLYYLPTTLPSPSFPFHHAAITRPLALEPELTRFHKIKDDPNPNPNPVEAHADAVLQKKDEPEAESCGSEGFVQKQVHKAFISCGTLDGHGSDSFRLKGYHRRKKAEENGQRRNVDYLRNRKVFGHPDEPCFRASPKTMRKRWHPSVPVKVDGNETTVMIRNIPSKYTRDLLVEFLDNHCMKVNTSDKEADNEKSEESSALAFDFIYLPIDFQSGMNKGYAFVNFTKPQAAWKFRETASNMKWDCFQSHKIREIVSARLQGKEKLERHFETMKFPYESEDVLPVCFSPPRDGVIKGEQRTMGSLIKRLQG